jgi:hypothetical protein
MKASIILCMAASFVFSTAAFAANPGHEGKGSGPCEQILKACEGAGFVKGEAKQGYGLWLDCVDPIMQGKTTVPGATKPLPAIDADLVAKCKAKNPKFGSGKVGTK